MYKYKPLLDTVDFHRFQENGDLDPHGPQWFFSSICVCRKIQIPALQSPGSVDWDLKAVGNYGRIPSGFNETNIRIMVNCGLQEKYQELQQYKGAAHKNPQFFFVQIGSRNAWKK